MYPKNETAEQAKLWAERPMMTGLTQQQATMWRVARVVSTLVIIALLIAILIVVSVKTC